MLRRALLAGICLLSMTVAVPLAFAQEADGEEDGTNRFCATIDDPDAPRHPVAEGIAERYEMDYADVMAWFCEPVEREGEEDAEDEDSGFGFGQIMLALETADVTGDSAEDYLARRAAGEGWGEIWKDLGLIGRPEGAGPPPWAGPPNGDDTDAAGAEDGDRPGGGPPPWAGQPGGPHGQGGVDGEDEGDDDRPGGGPPPWAGGRP